VPEACCPRPATGSNKRSQQYCAMMLSASIIQCAKLHVSTHHDTSHTVTGTVPAKHTSPQLLVAATPCAVQHDTRLFGTTIISCYSSSSCAKACHMRKKHRMLSALSKACSTCELITMYVRASSLDTYSKTGLPAWIHICGSLGRATTRHHRDKAPPRPPVPVHPPYNCVHRTASL
jgi:hypothetical protein